MGSIFIVRPENDDFLTSLSPSPLLRNVKVKQIEVDPNKRCWTVLFSGSAQGNPEFWNSIADQLTRSVSEIDVVTFAWEQETVQEERDTYMDDVLRSFTGPQITQTTSRSATKTNGSEKRKKGTRSEKRMKKSITDVPTLIADIVEEEQGVTIQAEVLSVSQRPTRTGKWIVMFDCYDGTDSITCKFFLDDEKDMPDIQPESWVKVKGNVQYQSFDGELSLMVQQINPCDSPVPIQDTLQEKRIEFHLHTKMSGMDGTIEVKEAVKQAADWGHEAIAITDHGGVQAFPAAYYAGKKHGVKIIYGVEGYLVDGEKDRPFHVILLAQNQQGLKNLYKIISYSHLNHFYRRPRIPRTLLAEHRTGLIVGTACEAGELYQAILKKQDNIEEVASFYDFFEIQPLGNNEFLIGTENVQSAHDLMRFNHQICELGEVLGKPVIATGDVHFMRPKDSIYRAILLAGQGFEDAEHQAPLYFRTTSEMLQEFSYLDEEKAYEVVVRNPQQLAAQIADLVPVPEGLHPPIIPEAEERLKELCYQTAQGIYGTALPDIVRERLEKELSAIIGNGYASLYYTAHKLVKKSNDDGYLVGSRGSVGSSFAATMCGITEVNPLPPHYVCSQCQWSDFITDGTVGSGVDLPNKTCPNCDHQVNKQGFDIPFEVFMGFHGEKVPDIDLNFSGEYQATINRYTEELFGSDNVFRAGTIGTLAEKTAYGFVKKYLEHVGDTKRNTEVNRMLKRITGVKRTTGQHPGGMIVVPHDMDIFDFTPIQYPANDSKSGIITTHFAFEYIHDSLVKLDNLGHKCPTIFRMLHDLTGIAPEDTPLDDPLTMSLFVQLDALNVTEKQIGTSLGVLGIPEFNTQFTQQMLLETKPRTFAELVSISGLSHGTDVWRNNAQELIKDRVTGFSNVIACRDDIMVYLHHKGLEARDAFRIMEQVRKGKGLQEEDVILMKSHDVPDWYVNSCNKIKYMFPKAHAVAYVMAAYRVAYFKVHHPAAFYATHFSMEIEDFDASLILQGEALIRRQMAEIQAKGNDATPKERNIASCLEVVIEALARNIEFMPVDLYQSAKNRFLVVGEATLLPPLASLQGLGVNAADNIVEARQDGEFTSIEDLRQRAKLTKTVIEVLREHGCLAGMSESNQLSLF